MIISFLRRVSPWALLAYERGGFAAAATWRSSWEGLVITSAVASLALVTLKPCG